MGIALNLIAAAFAAVWMIEYLGYNAGNNIHFLLLMAIVVAVGRLSLLIPWGRLGKYRRMKIAN
jgi:hypothetical protein